MPDRDFAAPSSLPCICLLATGGTIAGVAAAGGATRYTAGAMDISTLLAAAPGLDKMAHLQAEQIASVGSQDMTQEVWCRLAARIDAIACQSSVDGIVVTHGTDTLEETAYFLSLVLRTVKPVVLVAAMRPADALSADGPANLASAVAVAACCDATGRGPLVVMNDIIHGARDVQKTRSSGLEAFSSPNEGAVGTVHAGRVRFNRPVAAWRVSAQDTGLGATGISRATVPPAPPRFDLTTTRANTLPIVTVISMHVGLDARVIEQAAVWSDGLVIAGVGEGNMSAEAWQACQRVVAGGGVVVRSSRCPSGTVARNGELDDALGGTIASGQLSPYKARVLLMLGLTKTREIHLLQQMFEAD